MDPADLARKLAVALGEIVPPGFRVHEEQGMVFIEGAGYRAASEVADIVDQPGNLIRNVQGAVWNALSFVQDYIAEDLTTPWPATAGEVPSPIVSVTSDRIGLWFEDSRGGRVLEAPVIEW